MDSDVDPPSLPVDPSAITLQRYVLLIMSYLMVADLCISSNEATCLDVHLKTHQSSVYTLMFTAYDLTL